MTKADKTKADKTKADKTKAEDEQVEGTEPTEEEDTEDSVDDLGGITVRDPEQLRPVELPLVIEPPKSGWKNDAQAEYAANLNGYAYKNPKKWAKKKGVLLKRLMEIGDDEENIIKYRGNQSGLEYSNKLIQQ